MEAEQQESAPLRPSRRRPLSVPYLRGLPVVVVLAPVVLVLATRAFGNPLEQLLYGNIAPALRYLAVAVLWAGSMLVLHRIGQARRGVFYLVLLWLLLDLERFNFGVASLAAALLWTNVLWLALVVEMVVTGPLRASGQRPAARAFSTLYHCTLACVPLGIVAYNRSLGVPLGSDALFAVFQTNPVEAYGYARQFFEPRYVLVLAVVPLLLLANNWRQEPPRRRVPALWLGGLAAALALAVFALAPPRPAPQLWSLIGSSFTTYRAELAEYRAMRAQRAEGAGTLVATRSGPGETFVVVIGESQSRDHLSVHGYVRPTTPWLEAMSSDDGFVLFENAYSNHTHTDRVMGLAMTEASQYDDRIHYRSPSLIDVANEAGFTTYWVTNQVTIGGWDNLVTAMAEASHHYIGLNHHFGRTARTNVHDGETIPVLRRIAAEVDPEANTLVFIHLMGNHNVYCERFPDEFEAFDDAGPFVFGGPAGEDGFAERIDCYDNSIRYTDHVVARLLEEARKIDNLGGFLYFADHGQAVAAGTGHNSALFQYDMARIPLYAWFPDTFRASRSERFERLLDRRDAYVTNDLVYDLLIGVMGIETPHYDPRNDPGAAAFDLRLGDARTLHGQKRIADDPAVVQRQFTERVGTNRVIAHRVNTLGKLGDAVRSGFAGVEVDLIYRPTEDGGHFEPGHDDASRTYGDLESYLDVATGAGLSRLWLDIKNLGPANYRSALEELERLNVKYPDLRAMAIVESSTRDAWFEEFRARGWHTSYYLPTEQILTAMEAADRAALERWGEAIARHARRQRVAAVSFDIRLHPFVRDHLEPRLDGDVVYHVWDLSVRAWEPDGRRRLEAATYYRDERVRTIIVAMDSEFTI